MIEGYKRWHEEYNFKEPIEDLTKIYVRINDLCKENEEILELCRNNFKNLEEGKKYEVELWKKMKDLSLKEFYKIYDLLDVKFDSLNRRSILSRQNGRSHRNSRKNRKTSRITRSKNN